MKIYKCDRCGAIFDWEPWLVFQGVLYDTTKAYIKVDLSKTSGEVVMSGHEANLCEACRESFVKALSEWWSHE